MLFKNKMKLSGRKFFLFVLSLFIFFFLSHNLKAQNKNDRGFPAILEADLSAAATEVYHLQFNSAERHLHHAMVLLPDHPASYFFMTMLRWYQFTYDSLEYRNPVLEKALEFEAERTITVAKRYLKKNKNEATGFLYLGGALGAKGWYRVIRGQWIRAYFDGKKGYSLMRKVIEIDPELYDAYLGIGMYEYYAATLGPALRALASFSIRGDKWAALRSLQLAQYKSRYVRLEAAYFLWSGAMDEGRLADAKEIMEVLTQSYPESPLFRWCEIQTLFYQKKWVETILKGEKYSADALKASQSGNSVNPFNLLLAKVYYHCGAAAFNLRHYDRAKFYFKKAIEQHAEFVGWKAMAILRMGELLDMEGKRKEAIENYKKVLDLPKAWNSQRLAKERIKKPYQMNRRNGNNFISSPLKLWNAELQ